MKARDLLILKTELKMRSTADLLRRLGLSDTAFYRWMRDPEQELPVYYGLAAAALRAGLHPYEPGPVDPADLALYGGDTARKVFGRIVENAHDEGVKDAHNQIAELKAGRPSTSMRDDLPAIK